MDSSKQLRLGLNVNINDKVFNIDSNEMCGKELNNPFSSDIIAGKNTYVYDAHTYHTKVPPEGIKLAIEYYTNVGDTVLDPFCGSGMTGVASVEIGRKAILSDLSPAAVFIASNLTTPIDADIYMDEINKMIRYFEEEASHLYSTTCRNCSKKVQISYTVWSYDVTCNDCNQEFSLFDAAKSEKENVKESKILSEFPCPCCGVLQKKRLLKRQQMKPIFLGYRCSTQNCKKGNRDLNAPLNAEDLALLDRLKKEVISDDLWYPTDKFPIGVNTIQPIRAGITSIDKAYTPRALKAVALLWNYAMNVQNNDIKQKLLFTITSLYQRVTVFSEFRFWGGSGNIANYSVPAVMNEQNVFTTFLRKAKTIESYFKTAPKVVRDVSTQVQSATSLLHVADDSIDYIFTDPPFGSNINYSEMNFLWEAWLREKTVIKNEAIVSKSQKKEIGEYQLLLTQAFKECRRVLKSGSWLTVVFHNSSEKIWESLQNSLKDAGFIISGAQTFDKKHGTFKQYVSDNAVGYDIMVHCQKNDNIDDTNYSIEITLESVKEIVRDALKSDKSYSVKYLHVDRIEEFDYRKLYAKLLTETISKYIINISFDVFRNIVDNEIKSINQK